MRRLSALIFMLMCSPTMVFALDPIKVDGQDVTCALVGPLVANTQQLATRPPAESDEILFFQARCVAEMFNATQPDADKHRAVVGGFVQRDGPDRRMFFETISKTDVNKIHQYCVTAGLISGQIVSARAVPVPGSSTYVEWASRVGCGEIKSGLERDSVFLLTTPITLAHSAMITDALRNNGFSGLATTIDDAKKKVEQVIGVGLRGRDSLGGIPLPPRPPTPPEVILNTARRLIGR